MQREFTEGFSTFYYLMVCADGVIDERELRWGNKMLAVEQIDEKRFKDLIDQYSMMDKEQIFQLCIRSLKKCAKEIQLKCVAWMALIANSDGFMAPKEWQLLFNVYSRELQLDLKNVLEVQSDLQTAHSDGVFIS